MRIPPQAAASLRRSALLPSRCYGSLRADGVSVKQLPGQPANDADPAEGRRDPLVLSEVELRFIAETADRTRVELEHRDLDRHGEGWEGVRAGVDSGDGWPLYLRRFADVVSA